VPSFKARHIEVYVFRRRRRRVEFLILRRSAGRRLGGVWQPVTGKMRRGETAFAAAQREVLEETGIAPRRWWGLERPTLFYDAEDDLIEIVPRFAAEIRADERVRISREHSAHRFVAGVTASRSVLWENQRRGFAAVRLEVLRGGRLAKALEIRAPGPTRSRRAASKRSRTQEED